MLQPARSKFRKQFKGRIHGQAKGGNTLAFGSYGLKALEPERLNAREIEAARRALTRHMKRAGRVWMIQDGHPTLALFFGRYRTQGHNHFACL